MSKPTVFISYSHKDEVWKDRLETQLRVLQFEGMLETWTDRQIGAGDDWYEKIEEAMNRAAVGILLISADSLTSDFILREEVTRLIRRQYEGGLRIFPVIVRPCPWRKVGWLSRMQCRPKDGEPLSAGTEHEIETNLSAIAEEVADVLQLGARGTGVGAGDKCRYPQEDITRAKLPSTGSDLFGRDEELGALDRGRRAKAPTCRCLRAGYDLEIMGDRAGTAIGRTTRYEGHLPCETLAERLCNTR